MRTKATVPTFTSPREAARFYLRAGLQPHPVPFRSKRCLLDGWEDLRLAEADLDEAFPADQPLNIGIKNGRPSGNVYDVDLDCDQAVRAAAILLPRTGWVFGRASRPRSHQLYRAEGDLGKAFEKYQWQGIGTLVELRGTRSQTIYPGSVHEEDEPITWDVFEQPAEVELAYLQTAVAELAAGALLANFWQASAGRNDATLALCGGLLRAGWPVERVAKFVSAVAYAAHDEEYKRRGQEAQRTAEKLRHPANKVTGWTRLAELIGADGGRVVRQMLQWLALANDAGLSGEAEDIDSIPLGAPHPTLPPGARYGILGELLNLVEPETEADPAGILLHLLAAVGNAIGRRPDGEGPYFQVEGDRHRPTFFIATVGPTSTARKGTAAGRAFEVMRAAAPDWVAGHVAGGMTSGEGIIAYVRDRRVQVLDDGTEEVLDEGADVKNVLIVETEFGSVLRRMARDGNTLSPIIRQAWDGHTLASMSKHAPGRATNATVSIAAHITSEELRNHLGKVELFNGFANRFLWAEVRRSKSLPFGGTLLDLSVLGARLGQAITAATGFERIAWGTARSEWPAAYDHLNRFRSGLLGVVTARASSQVLRIALLYALLDGAREIHKEHLQAALALWSYCEASAERIFGAPQAETPFAEIVFAHIEAAGEAGLSRKELRDKLGRHAKAAAIVEALSILRDQGRIVRSERKTGGRTAEVWKAQAATEATEATEGRKAYETRRSSEATVATEVATEGVEAATEGGGDAAGDSAGDDTAGGLRSQAGDFGRNFGRTGEASETLENKAFRTSVASVASVAASPERTPTYRLINAAAELPALLNALDETAVVALDLETTGLDPRADKVRLLSLGVDTVDGGTFVYLIDCFAVDPAPVLAVLADKDLVAHNALFELRFLEKLGCVPRGRVHDTFLLAKVLTAGSPEFHQCGLDDCAARYLGVTLDKAAQKSDWSGTLTAEQLAYAATDVLVLPQLHAHLAKEVEAAGLQEVAELERRALRGVAWTAAAGVRVDRQALADLAEGFSADEQRLRQELDALAPARPAQARKGRQAETLFPVEPEPTPWNWNSPVQVKQAFALVGMELAGTDDAALARIDHPLAVKLRAYRAAAKLASSYGQAMLARIAGDGRIYAGWKQLGSEAGRMSCGTPNLQQVPKDQAYRACFVAPPGRVLVRADYSQIELRIAAKVTGDEALLAAYRDNLDLHTRTAQAVLGVPTPTKQDRQLAKALNFGLLYGMGARGFRQYAKASYDLELSEDQAAEYRRAFFRAYPGLKRWHARTGASKDAVTTATLAGRRRLAVGTFMQKLNSPVQGTGADGLKAAIALLWERRAEVPGAVPVLLVHDEVVIECAAEQADDVAAWLKQAMLDAMAPLLEPVPVAVEVIVGRTWAGD